MEVTETNDLNKPKSLNEIISEISLKLNIDESEIRKIADNAIQAFKKVSEILLDVWEKIKEIFSNIAKKFQNDPAFKKLLMNIDNALKKSYDYKKPKGMYQTVRSISFIEENKKLLRANQYNKMITNARRVPTFKKKSIRGRLNHAPR